MQVKSQMPARFRVLPKVVWSITFISGTILLFALADADRHSFIDRHIVKCVMPLAVLNALALLYLISARAYLEAFKRELFFGIMLLLSNIAVAAMYVYTMLHFPNIFPQ